MSAMPWGGPGQVDGRDASARVLVADLGATYLRIGLSRRDGPPVETVAVHRTAELSCHPRLGIAPAVVERLAEAATRLNGDGPGLAAAGIGVAAYVARDGTVLQRRPFGLEAGPELRDLAADRLGCFVAVDNDANMAALGELRFGAGRGCDDFVLLTLGTNIGMGLVVDGRVARGVHGAAGEVGFLLVPANRGRGGRRRTAQAGRLGAGQTDAPPGYAWLEDLAGGGALSRSLPKRMASGEVPDDRHVFARALAGDPAARTITRRAIEAWSLMIADLVALLDPGRIVLSGGLVEDLRPYLEPLRRRAAEVSPFPPEIRIGELGAQAGLVGAAVAAFSSSASFAPAPRPQTRRQSQPEPDQRSIVTGR